MVAKVTLNLKTHAEEAQSSIVKLRKSEKDFIEVRLISDFLEKIRVRSIELLRDWILEIQEEGQFRVNALFVMI